MIIPDGDVIVDPETSCTREVAVAKLLGWMQGPIRRAYILLAEDGIIPEDQLATMHSLPVPLNDLLAEFRNAARRKLQEAFDAHASDAVMQEREDAVAKEDERIRNAAGYFRDIDKELAKGQESSLLKIDQFTTDEKGETYLWLDSLEQWARKRYSVSVAEDESLTPQTAKRGERAPSDGEPWWTPLPDDPPAKYGWYTPARYFARALVRDDPTLRTKPNILVQKVTQSLTSAGIRKRGGKKSLQPATVKKALVNVCL